MNGLLYPLAFACIFLVGVVVLAIWRNAPPNDRKDD